MKHLHPLFTISILLIASSASYAAEPLHPEWNSLCTVATTGDLMVETQTGNKVTGKCHNASSHTLSLRTQNGLANLERSEIKRILWNPVPGDQVAKGWEKSHRVLHKTAHSGRPLATLAVLPFAIANAAAAIPVGLVSDLEAASAQIVEIQPK